jgi:hypothetical protein
VFSRLQELRETAVWPDERALGRPSGQYGGLMADRAGGPALDPTLSEWLKARDETRRHLDAIMIPVDAGWAQRLADLLATEQSWQTQYTELIAIGTPGRRFPTSNR